MEIQIISDTICPWCYIGKRQLESALSERPALQCEVIWRPFQLYPQIPAAGIDRAELIKLKYGMSAEELAFMLQRIKQAGEAVGIEFNYERITRTPNTLLSHCLLALAHDYRCQNEVAEAVFAAFFTCGKNISDINVLAEIGAEFMLSRKEIETALEDRALQQKMRDELANIAQMQVGGVPFFIIDGKYTIPGAQDKTSILYMLDKVEKMKSAIAR